MTETELTPDDLEGRPEAFSAESWSTQRRLAEAQADQDRAEAEADDWWSSGAWHSEVRNPLDRDQVEAERRLNRDVNRIAALVVGLVALAGPRRTRPLAGFLYGALLSRVHGAGLRRLEAELLRLFAERNAIAPRVDELVEGLEVLDGNDAAIREQVKRIGAHTATLAGELTGHGRDVLERLEDVERIAALGVGDAVLVDAGDDAVEALIRIRGRAQAARTEG